MTKWLVKWQISCRKTNRGSNNRMTEARSWWQDQSRADRLTDTLGGVWVRAKGGQFLNVKGYLWMKDGEREWGGWHDIHVAEAEVGISLRVVWIQRNYIQAFVFVNYLFIFSVQIFASAQPQLMGKTKTERACSIACWSRVCRMPPYTYCLCDEIKREKAIKDESRRYKRNPIYSDTRMSVN